MICHCCDWAETLVTARLDYSIAILYHLVLSKYSRASEVVEVNGPSALHRTRLGGSSDCALMQPANASTELDSVERANVHLESALSTITASQRQIVPSTETSSVEGLAPAVAS